MFNMDYMKDVIKEFHKDITDIVDGFGGQFVVERFVSPVNNKNKNHYGISYKSCVVYNEEKPFVYVSESEGVVEIHIANLPIEVQMDLMKKVFELEESFIQHRLDSVE